MVKAQNQKHVLEELTHHQISILDGEIQALRSQIAERQKMIEELERKVRWLKRELLPS